MNWVDWLKLAIALLVCAVIFAPEIMLLPVGYAFGGMMETSKSHRLVHVGIAFALGGPVLIAVTGLLACACIAAELWWSARFFGGSSALLLLIWIVGGIAIGVLKARHAAREQDPTAKCELPE